MTLSPKTYQATILLHRQLGFCSINKMGRMGEFGTNEELKLHLSDVDGSGIEYSFKEKTVLAIPARHC